LAVVDVIDPKLALRSASTASRCANSARSAAISASGVLNNAADTS
jgi:hypothetical protein